MDLPLIGLKGKRKSGKDTIAGCLIANHGYTRRAFADNLKMEIYNAFGHAMLTDLRMQECWEKRWAFDPTSQTSFRDWMDWLDAHKNDPAESEFGWIGPFLQWYGTEYRRQKCGDDYWLRQLEPKLGLGVVVADVRFPNEADLIRKHGGLIIHVSRPGAQKDGGARDSNHSSEALVDSVKADWTIHNTSTLEDLSRQTTRILELIYKERAA